MKKPYLLIISIFSFFLQNAHAFDGQEGLASWYGDKFHGKLTASGEIYDMNQLTAAHKTLPFGSHVLVTNLKNNKSVEVRITDRGPFVAGRIIDLSRAAAEKIGMKNDGTTLVRLKVISVPDKPFKYPANTVTSSVKSSTNSQSQPEEEPTTVLQETKTPEESNATVSGKTFSIQAGAFSKMDNAINCRERIFNAIGKVQVDLEQSGKIYRVKIRYIEENVLESIKSRLSAAGLDQLIVKEETE